MIPFGEWTPDSPDLGNTAREALGVIPEKQGYRPFKSLATTSNALTARCQGAAWFRAPDGSTKNFAGDATKLYLMGTSQTYNDVSAVSTVYNCSATNNWRWAQFGSTIYATDAADLLQSFDLNSGTKFITAPGSPPQCTYLGIVRRFLVLAGLGSLPQRVQWSGENNPATFVSSATTLSDFQDMPDGGAITGFVGGQFGLVFQESAIQLMSFEGSPTVFRFDKIATDFGATIPNSVAGWNGTAFFAHRSGFYRVVGGQTVASIGRDKVDRWFWGLLDQTRFDRVSSAFDPVNALYAVSFPTGSSDPNQLLLYNALADRWSHVAVTCEMIYSGATQQSWTIEQLDTFGAIEDVPFSFDSSYWVGVRNLLLSGFFTDHKGGTFSGGNAAAAIGTGEVQPIPGRRAKLRSVRPMIDGGAPTISAGYRASQQAPVVWTADMAAGPSGTAPFRVDSRYFRFLVKQPAGSTYQWAQGVDDVDARPGGMR